MPEQTASGTPGTCDRLLFPLFALLAVAVPLAYQSQAVAVAYYSKLVVFQAALAGLCGAWLMAGPSWHFRARSPFVLPVVLYLGIGVLSALQAVNRVEALVQISHQLSLTLLFLVLLHTVKPSDVPRYLVPIAVGGGMVACIGVVQYLGLGLLWIPSAGMPSATLGYRNFAAMAILLSLPAGAYLFTSAGRGRSAWFWGLCCAVMLVFLVYTRTRGAWIGLGLAVFVTAAGSRFIRRPGAGIAQAWWQRTKNVVAVAAGVVLVLSAIPPRMGDIGIVRQRPEKAGIGQTMASVLTAQGDKDRLTLWENTWEMIVDQPILGVGIGNWQFLYPLYDDGRTIDTSAMPRRPHNDYLWVWSELGLPGILVHIWILGLALVQAARLAARARHDDSRYRLALCLGLAVLAIAGDALFSFPRERITPSVYLWSTLAFLAVLSSETRGRAHPRDLRYALAVPWGAAALVVLCLGVSTRALAFDRHYARAAAHVEQHGWEGAIREATSALDLGIFDAQVLLLRGVAHLAQRDYVRAAEDNERCLEYHPNFVNALNNLAIAYNGQGGHEEAVRALDRILEIDPGHVEVHANLGVAYQGLGRYGEAIQAFERAMERSPEKAELRYHLAVVYEHEGNLEEAASVYARILGDDPQNAKAHYRLGVVHQKQGIHYKAIHEFEQALRADGGYLPAYFSIGEVSAIQGDTIRAIESFSTFMEKWAGDPKASEEAASRIEALK